MEVQPISGLIFNLKSKCSWLEDKIFYETRLTPAEYKGIDVLTPDDRISAAEFARRMNLSKSRCSRVIEKMMNDGFLKISSVPGDRRSIQLSLTKKGCVTQEKVERLMEKCNQSITEKLTQKQVYAISQSLQKLLNIIE
jgi:DNA-binding MarR family transcriptional regulator